MIKTKERKPSPVPRAECNVPDCGREPTNRGLCDAHSATHRGLVDRTVNS